MIGRRRAALVAAVAAALAIAAPGHARADIAALGGLAPGQPFHKAKPAKLALFGCAGTLYATGGGDGKVVKVSFFAARACSASSVAAAVTRGFGASPVGNASGDQLWEGKVASVVLTRAAGDHAPLLELVPHGAGTQRTCWPDDGFAAFWAAFKAGVAGGRADAVAAAFRYPFATADGGVEYADAGALAAGWHALIGADDVKAIAAGKRVAACSIDDDRYTIDFAGSYAKVAATRTSDGWRWTAITVQSPD